MSFKRITDNRISADSLNGFFNEVRMRDEHGQPLAYIDFENFRIEFNRATLRRDCVEADARIYER